MVAQPNLTVKPLIKKSNMNNIEEIIHKLNLSPHPEGGYFKETYRSDGSIGLESLSSKYKGKRNYSTSIYFLLTSGSFSSFHRILQDEIWHFYKGSAIRIHMITEDGEYSNILLGNDFENGQLPQFVVKGGVYFAAEADGDNTYALVGCTVAPGFDFTDFEIPKREILVEKFPQHKEVVIRLSR